MKSKIDDDTTLLSVIFASNEIGTLQPIADIAQIINRVRLDRQSRGVDNPIYLHTDASQAANYLDLHISKLRVDLMTLNGAKTYGPKQSGALYVRVGTKLSQQIEGGGQEKGLRSGTENVATSVGFAKALGIAQKMRRDEHVRILKLRKKLLHELKQVSEAVLVLGHAKHTLPNIVSFMIPGIDGERVVMELDELGVQCATGSACSALKEEPSHVIRALGFSGVEASGTIRLSMGRGTDEQAVEAVVRAVREVLGSEHVWHKTD